MKKSKNPRPVVPCWYCQSADVSPITYHEYSTFGDVRDSRWYICARCGATAQEKPTSLGPLPKLMPWGAMTKVIYRNRR